MILLINQIAPTVSSGGTAGAIVLNDVSITQKKYIYIHAFSSSSSNSSNNSGALWIDNNAPEIQGNTSMNCRERGSHARGVYSTQYTSRMGTAT